MDSRLKPNKHINCTERIRRRRCPIKFGLIPYDHGGSLARMTIESAPSTAQQPAEQIFSLEQSYVRVRHCGELSMTVESRCPGNKLGGVFVVK